MEDLSHIFEEPVDIRENRLYSHSPELLHILLGDHTTGKNIFWATNDYLHLGPGYGYCDEILPDNITGDNSGIIMPRVLKEKRLQQSRVREKAEVFTPSWICNAQNNLIDDNWFGRANVFNTESFDGNAHIWKPSEGKVFFPEGKDWTSYIKSTRLEITCGEAPYLASRYDTTTGDYIEVPYRIGILDRKLRIVSENTMTEDEWRGWAAAAYRSTYGYEWQGDSLLLAREALLFTYADYFAYRFLRQPSIDDLKTVAEIISWNLWQMDGLKGVVPDSCHNESLDSLFADCGSDETSPCPGCARNDIHLHNGLYCIIMDWERNRPVKYISLIKQH